MTLTLPGPLVSTSWLAEHLGEQSLVLLDGSYKLPGVTPTARADYEQRHIRGARFFDIDQIADTSSPLPHMLPDTQALEGLAGRLGLSNDSVVVVYDGAGLMSAGRVWWSLRTFGHDKVAILDGGLRKWLAEQRPVTADIPAVVPATFRARFNAAAVRSKAQVAGNLATADEQLIDTRSAARFAGEESEVRPGLRPGHIPHSLNLPFQEISSPETGEVKPGSAIRKAFETAGLDLARPVVATCGSGVTAGALAFGLHLLGKTNVAIYDGSWSEWGLPGETPVETGPATGAPRS
ncbi:3-mercaptopyruvate sulfurtransferase [Rhizobium sp. RU36D]|uniref:3-mercaptopyruvate sulfurtransferase n=1 Tax=Rhizobium sp. RU36D TaxID=1907415 RepID=UPI0009D85556|nr:3-mercaptopyruvate sulfurtransferase [Rhizobium sp. RU36D]SMD14658.1 thiosulfate/3-mercaptopyruvate sulfurtransferase [Rhizobium sp. RU36D]